MPAVAVVGAGVTGLVTAIGCALAGHRVTLLDRGPIPNPASTSADQHRALRVLRPDDAATTRRMADARARWLALESLLGTRLFRPVGIVTAWPLADLGAVTGTAAAAGARVEVVEPDTLPQVVFPAGTTGVLDPGAGVLLAQELLRAAAAWLGAHPAVTVRPWCAVAAVVDNKVTLADGEVLGADAVVVAAGPWSGALVDLPVVLHRQTMVYLRPPEELLPLWERSPGVGRLGTDNRAWLLPPGGGALLKISSDAVCREVEAVDDLDGGPWADRLLAEPILTDAHRYAVAAVRDCHYATAPDTGGALLARVGPALWSRAACGGTGFSTAPLVAAEIVEAMQKESA